MAVKTNTSKMVVFKSVTTKNLVKGPWVKYSFCHYQVINSLGSSILAKVMQAVVALYIDGNIHNFPSVRRW